MADAALRAELEAVYNAQIAALKNKDAEAYVATTLVPEGTADDVHDPAKRAEFTDAADFLLELTPELSQTTFVTIKTEGDDLAGYYYTTRDENFVNVTLITFVRVEGRWLLAPENKSSSFTPGEGQDVQAKVAELIETSDMLRLARPKPPEPGPDASGWATDVRAVLNVMAYDYELEIAINGTPLKSKGGHSWSGVLFGVAPAASPAEPAVLQSGMNEIEIAYRRTTAQSGPSLSVELLVPPDRLCFRLTTAGASGKSRSHFRIPMIDSEEIEPVIIEGKG